MRSVETASGIISLDEGLGIVHIKNKQGVEQSLADARENIAQLRELTGDRAYPVLVDLEGSTLSREARNYYGSAEVRDRLSGLALLVTNPVARVLANLFIGMKQPVTPTRLFTSEREAIEWLRQLPAREP
jgi:hypothetical protein